MSLYRLTPKAKADLRSIWSYIASDNVQAADLVEEAIHDACTSLAKAPLRGHPRSDLTKLPVRFWSVVRYSRYVIVYDPAVKPLRIIRIFHGARNVARELVAER
jgi:plasmid stabilization system protein ParE